MDDLDSWLNQVTTLFERELESAITEELTTELKKYGNQTEQSILGKWDSYYNNYNPKVYKRTGQTRSGIQLERNVTVKNGKLQIAVQFLDSHMYRQETYHKTSRNVFMSMDRGWDFADAPDRYANFGGLNILNSVENQMRILLPDYIDFEIIWNGR